MFFSLFQIFLQSLFNLSLRLSRPDQEPPEGRAQGLERPNPARQHPQDQSGRRLLHRHAQERTAQGYSDDGWIEVKRYFFTG